MLSYYIILKHISLNLEHIANQTQCWFLFKLNLYLIEGKAVMFEFFFKFDCSRDEFRSETDFV